MRWIKSMNWTNVGVGSAELVLLAALLAHKATVAELDLSLNENLGDEIAGLGALGQALALSRVTSVDLSRAGINANGATALAEALEACHPPRCSAL